MSLPRKQFALVVPLVAALGAATVAAIPSASAADPIECDAEFVSLRVGNGQNQYFTCNDSGGEIRQTFASKNPWIVDPEAPAIFEQPGAGPAGARGQVYTGSSQGVGVISSEDATGAERDSIAGTESLTLVRDQGFERNFAKLQLGITVLADAEVVVDPVDANGVVLPGGDSFTAKAGYSGSPVFEGVTPWDAAGFKISAGSGEFTIDGKQTTRFYFRDNVPPGAVSDLQAERLATTLTLTWTNPGDEDLSEVTVTRDGAEVCEGDAGLQVCADTGLQPATDYTYTVTTTDTSGNSASVTETFTTRDGLSEGNPSQVVTNGQSQIQAQFVPEENSNCPVTDEAPLPFELTLTETRDAGATSPNQVEFEFVEFDDRNVEDCKFTLRVFSETTQILKLAFDADGDDGSVFEEVEQELCVDGAPVPGKTTEAGSRNDSISCLESSTLATGIAAPDGQSRDGQLAVLTGYFDARGKFFR